MNASESNTEVAAANVGIVDSMRRRTAPLHVIAERTGFIHAMLTGHPTRDRYALFLRNLLPMYQALESGLGRCEPSLIGDEIRRAQLLERDLVSLAGATWATDLPLLVQGAAYAEHVARASEGDGSRLVAHAYVRYLGDLAGGAILKRSLESSLGLGADCLSFYEFPRVASVPSFVREYRAALDKAAAAASDTDALIEEAAVAFQLNIDLSVAIG